MDSYSKLGKISQRKSLSKKKSLILIVDSYCDNLLYVTESLSENQFRWSDNMLKLLRVFFSGSMSDPQKFLKRAKKEKPGSSHLAY